MKAKETTERVCNKGCNPEPQPIANFYKYPDPSAEGIALYKWTCKVCECKREKARYHSLPKDKRKRRATKGFNVSGKEYKMLSTVDLIPCVDCGLRGHVAGDKERCMWAGGASLGLGQGGNYADAV